MVAWPAKVGAPCGIRTHGPRIRNPVLYPSELRGRPDREKVTPMCGAGKEDLGGAISLGARAVVQIISRTSIFRAAVISIWLMTTILFDRIAACWLMDLRGRRPAPCSRRSGLPMKI